MRGLIIEGVSGSGKSTLARHLQRLLAASMPANTKLFLSEHYSERVLEHRREAGALRAPDVLAHLGGLLDLLEPLRLAKASSKFAGRAGNATILVVIERFLLGHLAGMRMADPASWTLTVELVEAIEALYARADACGLRRVVLRVPPGALPDRLLSTLQHRSDAWRRHLQGHGDDAAIVAWYGNWQAVLLEVCERLHGSVKPWFVDVGPGWDDARYGALADDLYCRFLAERS